MPPLPEDAVLAQVAPEECLVYASWSGMATPDAKSKNQTEQLLAEPEVQRLASEIERVIVARIGEGAPREQAEAARDAIRWGKKLLTRPVAAFVSSVGPSSEGLDVRGGLIVSVGGDAAELRAAMEKYQALLPGAAEKVDIDGMSCYRVKLGPGMPPITWGISGKGTYLLIGVGEGSLEGMRQRARGSAARLAHRAAEATAGGAAFDGDVRERREARGAVWPAGRGQTLDAMTAAGLGNVTSFSAVERPGRRRHCDADARGHRGGAGGRVRHRLGKPLAAADLAPIPRDANFAVAARLDACQVLDDRPDRSPARSSRRPREEFNANLKQLEAALGRGPAPRRARLAGRRVVRLQFVGRGRADPYRADRRGAGEGLRAAFGRPGQAPGRGQGGPGQTPSRRAEAGQGPTPGTKTAEELEMEEEEACAEPAPMRTAAAADRAAPLRRARHLLPLGRRRPAVRARLVSDAARS